MKTKLLLLPFFIFATITVNAQDAPFQWVKSFTSTNSVGPHGMTLDSAGNIYTTGSFYQTADFDPGAGVSNLTATGITADAFVCKLDAGGNFIWAKQFKGLGDEFGSGIAVDAAGNTYITGTFQGKVDFDPGTDTFNLTPTGPADIFIVKLDPDGNFVWANGFGTIYNDMGQDIVIDPAGNIVTSGYYSGTVDFDPGADVHTLTGTHNFVAKYDAAGNYIWAKNLGGYLGFSQALKVDASGNIYTAGNFTGTSDFDPDTTVVYNLVSEGDYFSAYICKMNASGNLTWARSMGGTGDTYGSSIAVDTGGNVYSTGYYTGTSDMDPGTGTVMFSAANKNTYITKVDASGNFVWAKQFSGTDANQSYAIALDALENVYTTGGFKDTTDFNPNTGVYNLTTEGSHFDPFVSRLDKDGNFIWAKQFKGISDNYAINIATRATGVYIAGYYEFATDFDPGPAVVSMDPGGITFAAFIVKLMNIGDGILEYDADQAIRIYPNPGNGNFFIQADQNSANTFKSITVVNILGEKIVEANISSANEMKIDLSDQPDGIYFIQLHSDQDVFTKKIVLTK